MLHDLRSWIGEDPKRMPKTLFKMLRVHHQSGNYGDAACPTLRQVQQSINYVRTKELHHKSTVPAVEEALQHWVLPTAQEDQEIHHPFVFGVEKVDGKPRVGNGGLQSFRVGTIFQCGLDNDTCNDIVYDNNVMHSYSYIGFTTLDVMNRYKTTCEDNPRRKILCHVDTTFSTNKSGYPVFVFGYSDMAGSFHVLCICITSQRTHDDVAWLLKSLKKEFEDQLDFAWEPRLLMGDADKAQYLGMTTAMDQQLPEIEYLMCFYHVIKKCYERRTELTNEEWRDVSFDIYLLHMSASRVDLGDLMAVVHDKWATSRGLRKFRRYFFSQWLPYNRAYGGTDDVRFWKWQVYHSPPGSSYTNNPTEHFNCELKDVRQLSYYIE
ncbi:hypothetical protein DYB37_009933 [Aphanomyces astaci]|uniref:MULE transposase domain-containing protein n=2 Tax=Aphanomyces astaci TaxID=112090 RepID=A0A397A4T0_APHAT|nr:hypothetical protein DYB25_009303 [Aphanomyces astaci]RHY73608.1 hypothetical protein DYB38_006310 [Aphanomyces astaci]RHZ25596.1 hypothetical protein DYB37_009933 [Aphanomyces astaci]